MSIETRIKINRFKRKFFIPVLKIISMRLIIFYQRHISKKTCLYKPTCSQYMLESINNNGFLVGLILGIWRILRCNPFSKGGFDPAKENFFKLRWVL